MKRAMTGVGIEPTTYGLKERRASTAVDPLARGLANVRESSEPKNTAKRARKALRCVLKCATPWHTPARPEMGRVVGHIRSALTVVRGGADTLDEAATLRALLHPLPQVWAWVRGGDAA